MALGPGFTMTFDLVAPPQPDERRTYQLARMHMSALFYFVTYNEAERRGRRWAGGFHPVTHAFRCDWGSPVMRGFMEATRRWEPRIVFAGRSCGGQSRNSRATGPTLVQSTGEQVRSSATVPLGPLS